MANNRELSQFANAVGYNGGNIGIGSDTPGATLDLQSTDTEILLRLNTKPLKNGYLDIVSDANRRGVIRFKDTDDTSRWSIGKGDSDELTNTSFHISSGNSGGNSAKLVITSGGYVSIGGNYTQTDAKLQVNGNAVIGTDNVGLVEFTSTGVPYFAVAADASNYRSTRINVVSGGGYADLSFDTMGTAAKTGLPSAGSLVGTIMYLDASTQRVGIGTNNPGQQLDVNGTLRLRANNTTTYATALYSRLDSTHCTVLESYLNNNTPFELIGSYADGGGANPRVVISAGGQNVGIGTDNPGQKLTVLGTTSLMATNSTNQWMAYTHTDNTFRLNYNGAGADEVTITSGGNIGIHETSPARQLSVYNDSNTGVEIKSGTTGQSSIFFTDTDDGNIGMIGYYHSDDSMFLRTNNDTRVTINSSGHTLFSGLTSNIDTRNVKGISVQSPGGITFKRTGSTGSRNWRLRPDDLSAWGSLEFSVAPTDGSSDIPDAAGDVVLELKSNKDVKINNGNLILTNTKGISFYNYGSGTGVSSNTLDDYEEGTWTPNVTSGGVNWHDQHGIYTKIGNLVVVNMWLRASGTSSSTGGFSVTGLPFASTTTSSRMTGAIRLYNPANYTGRSGAIAWMSGSSTEINCVEIDSNGRTTATNLNHNIWQNGAEVHVTMSYPA